MWQKRLGYDNMQCEPITVAHYTLSKLSITSKNLKHASSICLNASYVARAWILRVIRMSLIANKQPRKDARLLGGRIESSERKFQGRMNLEAM